MYHEDQWKVNGGKLKRVLESIVVQSVHTRGPKSIQIPISGLGLLRVLDGG